ncbi:Linear gramicidin synthase subunit B [compost metagenome]
MNILSKELSHAYNHFIDEKIPRIQRNPIQYKDYTLWLNDFLKTKDAKSSRAFWADILKKNIEPLRIPLDYMRKEKPIYKSSTVKVVLPMILYQKIKDCAYTNTTSFSVVLYTSVNILLYCLTQQHKIIIATPTSGRFDRALASEIGFFVNTLPLVSELNGDDTLSQTLAKINDNCLAALANQIFPFELMLNDMDYKDPYSLFNVMVNIGNYESFDVGLAIRGLTIEEPYIARLYSDFDLNFTFTENGDAMELFMIYNQSLFKEDTITVMTEMLLKIVDLLCVLPDTLLSDVNKNLFSKTCSENSDWDINL